MQYAGNKQKSDMYNKLLAKETGEPYRPNFFGGLTKDDYGSVTGANYKANSLLLRQQANQIRLDKEFPVYKDYLDGKLLSGKITEDEHDLLVKKADEEGKLFSRRNRGVIDQMIKQMHYQNTEEETKRHNKTTESIQQQNADTKVGQLGVAQKNAATNAGKAEADKRLKAEKIIAEGLKNGTWVKVEDETGRQYPIKSIELKGFLDGNKKRKKL